MHAREESCLAENDNQRGLVFFYRSYSTGKFYGFGGRDNFLREKKNLTLGSWLPCQWLKVLKNLNELLQETQKFARAEVGQISKFQFQRENTSGVKCQLKFSFEYEEKYTTK